MNWIIGCVVAIAALVIGRWSAKGDAVDLQRKLWETERRRMEAEARYLEALQRELALLLLRHDRQALLDAHARVQAFGLEMRDAKPEKVGRAFAQLTTKFPNYEDFDLIQLRPFVPVDMSQIDLAEVAERYEDIGRFLVVMPNRKGVLPHLPETHWTTDRRVLERAVADEEKAAAYRQEMTDHWLGRTG